MRPVVVPVLASFLLASVVHAREPVDQLREAALESDLGDRIVEPARQHVLFWHGKYPILPNIPGNVAISLSWPMAMPMPT